MEPNLYYCIWGIVRVEPGARFFPRTTRKLPTLALPKNAIRTCMHFLRMGQDTISNEDLVVKE